MNDSDIEDTLLEDTEEHTVIADCYLKMNTDNDQFAKDSLPVEIATQVGRECVGDTCVWNPNDAYTHIPCLKVKKLRSDAPALKKAYDRPACVDISITHLIKVENGIAYFGTGYAFECPEGHYVDLVSRSSGPKHGWTVANCIGKIDEDYRGEIIFALQPTSSIAASTAIRLFTVNAKSIMDEEYSTRSQIPMDDRPDKVIPSPDQIVQHLISTITLPLSLGQFSLVKKVLFNIEEVDILNTSTRGTGGFGSSN